MYLIHAQGKKMPYFYRLKHLLVTGQGVKNTFAARQLKNSGESTILTVAGGLLTCRARFPTTSRSQLRPGGHSCTAIRNPRRGYLLHVSFNTKNPNRSVNIIIYLSLQ